MKKKISKNIQTALNVLKDEIKGDVNAALKKLTPDYRMTWVYKGNGKNPFPRTSKNIRKELEEVYPIKGRKYDIRNIAEGKKIVMIEMVECYPDPKTKKMYRTPLVVVLEIRNGKIQKGRHYCDPNVSYLHVTKKQIEKIFK